MKTRFLLRISILTSAFCINLGCKPWLSEPSDSSVKLSDGEMDALNTFPAVFGFGSDKIEKPDFAMAACTGTAISSSVLITAAHCLSHFPSNTSYWLVDPTLTPVRGLKGELITGKGVINPDFNRTKEKNYFADFALLQYPPATFKDVLRFSPNMAKKSDTVTMIGYGYAEKSNKVGRQIGTSTIFEVVDSDVNGFDENFNILREYSLGMYWILKKSGVTGTIPGDSGGPLLLNGAIVGVLRGGTGTKQEAFEANGVIDDSIYTNIHHPSNLKFLQDYKSKGWDIPNIPTIQWQRKINSVPDSKVNFE